MGWDPSQYLKFSGERLRPAVDLLARIPAAAPETVVDLGCGTGNLTPLLLQRWPDAAITGVVGARSHVCVTETIEQGPWRARLDPHLRRRPVAEPQRYWQMLQGRTAALQIWETEYLQVLQGDNPVAEYVKGSWLKQFLDRLEEPERSAFEADYRARVLRDYPPEASGHTLFPFRRVFILAQRPGG